MKRRDSKTEINGSRVSVFILHNTVTPYRLPLFEELNQHYDINVLFCERKTEDRKWKISVKGYSFSYKIIPSIRISRIIINPSIIFELARSKNDVYIVAENEENYPSILFVCLWAFLKRKPLVLWNEHVPIGKEYENYLRRESGNIKYNLKRRLTNLTRVIIYKFPKKFLSMSGTLSDQFLKQYKVSEDRIYTNTQIMPKTMLAINDDSKEYKKYGKYLLYLGYLRPEKSIDELIKTFSDLRVSSYRLLIVGVGPEKDKLTKMAINVKNISFLDYIDGPKKASLLSNAAALVLPSMYEPWGLVVNEALYYSTPVIVSDRVAASDLVIEGNNGLRYEYGNRMGFKTTLNNFMREENLREKLSNGAKNTDVTSLSDTEYGIRHFIKAIDSLEM